MKVGSVVTLKSGGVKMTIIQINDDGSYACHWFENGELKANVYSPKCLKVVEE